jgi:hypothetical protein
VSTVLKDRDRSRDLIDAIDIHPHRSKRFRNAVALDVIHAQIGIAPIPEIVDDTAHHFIFDCLGEASNSDTFSVAGLNRSRPGRLRLMV